MLKVPAGLQTQSSEFKLCLHNNIHFQTNPYGKGIEHLFSFNYGLNSITFVLLQGCLWH